MHRQWLLSRLDNYTPFNADEQAMHRRLREFVRQHSDCFERSLQLGHITGSAWIVNHDRSKVLMIHHRKLDRWLQPGGHSDGDSQTLNVALREAREETCLPVIGAVNETIFDIDIHTIPARKEEPEHEHFDVRFLLQADEADCIARMEETNDIAWMTLEQVLAQAPEASILRMVEKTRLL